MSLSLQIVTLIIIVIANIISCLLHASLMIIVHLILTAAL